MEGEAVRPGVQLKSHSPHVDRCSTSNSTVQPADAHQDTTGYAYTVCSHTYTRVSKEKMKEHADVKSYVKPSNLSEEDKVLATRYPSHTKATTLYDPNPHAVRGRKGAMITAKRKDRKIRHSLRN